MRSSTFRTMDCSPSRLGLDRVVLVESLTRLSQACPRPLMRRLFGLLLQTINAQRISMIDASYAWMKLVFVSHSRCPQSNSMLNQISLPLVLSLVILPQYAPKDQTTLMSACPHMFHSSCLKVSRAVVPALVSTSFHIDLISSVSASPSPTARNGFLLIIIARFVEQTSSYLL